MEEWHYQTASDLEASLLERLRRFPREPDMLVFGLRSLCALGLRAWLRVYHRLRIEGRHHLPGEGSFILVANHTSHLDALSVVSSLPLNKLHRTFPAAASDYFFVNPSRTAFSAIVVNALPFQREVNIRQSLDLCRHLLGNPGNILLVFPEGTRSTTGVMGKFKPGVGALVAGSTIPVVPCHIDGAFAAWPKGRLLPWPRALRIRFGAPLTFEKHTADRESVRAIADTLKHAVHLLAEDHA
jgi:1-acyl-sn-glycerol-3-phosphate acyltransferase/long-chain acyl-CoA synthetase